jgi:MoxR-like ATPase
MEIADIASLAGRIKENVEKVIISSGDHLDLLLTALIAGGHVLLDDVPGTGKTVTAKALAKSLGVDMKRIQFTPDLLPGDVTGMSVFNQKENSFEFREGPAFTNVLLADEINRATPRSQSALLEVMEEKQISVDGTSYPMEEPYMVMATQNPVESFGTFPLPEAQMDRFFMRLKLGYMTREQEISVLRRPDSKELLEKLDVVVSDEELAELRRAYPQVRVSNDLAAYIMNIVEATRSNDRLLNGVSARGSLALYRACQISAALQGRDYVIPEDVKREALCVLPHRIILDNQNHVDNVRFLMNLLDEVPVPLETL